VNANSHGNAIVGLSLGFGIPLANRATERCRYTLSLKSVNIIGFPLSSIIGISKGSILQ
jgi:hypothetical protein